MLFIGNLNYLITVIDKPYRITFNEIEIIENDKLDPVLIMLFKKMDETILLSFVCISTVCK